MGRGPEYVGIKFTIQCLALADGSEPVGEFLDALDARDRRKLDVLFEMLGDLGRISNDTKFKKLAGREEIWGVQELPDPDLLLFHARPARDADERGDQEAGQGQPRRPRAGRRAPTLVFRSEGLDAMSNREWIERQTATPEARREYEQERLVLWTTERIAELMQQAAISRADLARLLGTSRANVTGLMSGERNMTLRTLADVCFALGYRAELRLEPLRQGEFIGTPVQVVHHEAEPEPLAPPRKPRVSKRAKA
jgi:transcriptional regulator with XRE-family HTH domain